MPKQIDQAKCFQVLILSLMLFLIPSSSDSDSCAFKSEAKKQKFKTKHNNNAITGEAERKKFICRPPHLYQILWLLLEPYEYKEIDTN